MEAVQTQPCALPLYGGKDASQKGGGVNLLAIPCSMILRGWGSSLAQCP